MRMRPAAALLVLCAGCASQDVAPVAERAAVPPGFPAALYAQAFARGEPVYRVEPEQSEVVIKVYRGGALARFGHDHVVASRDVRGYVRLPAARAQAQADLYLPLDTLVVDETARRAQAGLDTQPSQQDIEGTRRNMMEKVLEAERHPFAVLRLTPGAAPATLHAELTLHGTTRAFPVTVDLDTANAGSLIATGRFSLNQSDFGITPFAVLGGALRVQDRVDIDFRVQAARVSPSESFAKNP